MPESKTQNHHILSSPIPDSAYLQFFEEDNKQREDQNVTWSRIRIDDNDVAYVRSDLAIKKVQEYANECQVLKVKCQRLTNRLLLVENQTKIITAGRDKERQAALIDLVTQLRKVTGQHETEIKQDAWYFTAGKFDINEANRLFGDAMIPKEKGKP